MQNFHIDHFIASYARIRLEVFHYYVANRKLDGSPDIIQQMYLVCSHNICMLRLFKYLQFHEAMRN